MKGKGFYMKKLFYIFLTMFIFLIPCCKVFAAGFVVDPSTLNSLTSGAESLQYISMAQNGYVPMSGVTSRDLNQLIIEQSQKATKYEITEDDIKSVVPLSDSPYEIASVVDTWEMFYLDGEKVLPADYGNLRYCTFDNGYYSGECIVSPNGQLVARNVTGFSNEPIAKIRIGGSQMTYDEYVEAVQSAADYLSDHNFSYNSNGQSVNPSFYLFYGSNGNAESLYISNQFLPGQVVPTNTSLNTVISSWYANDLTLFNHSVMMGESRDYSVQEGSYSKDGYNYRYRVSFATRTQANLPSESYSDWLNNSTTNRCFGKSNTIYDSSIAQYESMSISTYLPTEGEIEGDLAAAISLAYALDVAGEIVGTLSIPYVDYDPDQPVTKENKLVVVPIDIDIEDDYPVIPGTDEDVEEGEIAIPETIAGTIPSGTDFQIPIVSGLQSKFPFSIPWDIKNLLKGLRAVRRPPKFDVSWYIRPLDYTWVFSLDLSQFETVATIFRNCLLILFIIGLAKFSYDHFFGA